MRHRAFARSVLALLVLLALLSALPTARPLAATPRATAAAGDILVTPPSFDDIGLFMTEQFDLLQTVDWSQIDGDVLMDAATLASARSVFINCGTSSTDPALAGQTLRNYVANGGTLYASDWGYTYIEEAFPEYVLFYRPTPDHTPEVGNDQILEARVVDPGLANYLFGDALSSTLHMNYDLPGWAVIDRPRHSDVQVLLTGDIEVVDANLQTGETITSTLVNRPLAVVFPHGQGQVVYTTFHNEAQLTTLERRLVEYIVLEPFTWTEQKQLNAFFGSSTLFQAREDLNKLSQSQTVAGFYNTRGNQQMHFRLATEAGTYQLRVYRPNGTLFGQIQGGGQISVDVPAAQSISGTWRYEVTGLAVPDVHYPLAVGIGVTPRRHLIPLAQR